MDNARQVNQPLPIRQVCLWWVGVHGDSRWRSGWTPGGNVVTSASVPHDVLTGFDDLGGRGLDRWRVKGVLNSCARTISKREVPGG